MLRAGTRERAWPWTASLVACALCVGCSGTTRSQPTDLGIGPTSSQNGPVDSTSTTAAIADVTSPATSSSAVSTPSSVAISPLRRFQALDALVKAIVSFTRDGSPNLSAENVLRLTPSLPEDYLTEVDGRLAMIQPIDDGCGWFVERDHHEIALGFSPGTACATASVPQLTLDGAGVPWGAEALDHVDQIATGLASRLSDWAVQKVLQPKAIPLPSAAAAEFPGLEFVDKVKSVGQAAIVLADSEALIAVRGQSGSCYLVRTSVSSHTTSLYGVAPQCTTDAAARLATLSEWP
jgi:hypothetical protein